MSVAATVFNDAKVPFYVGADSMVKDGGLATYGINYKTRGAETAKMAVDILEDELEHENDIVSFQDDIVAMKGAIGKMVK